MSKIRRFSDIAFNISSRRSKRTSASAEYAKATQSMMPEEPDVFGSDIEDDHLSSVTIPGRQYKQLRELLSDIVKQQELIDFLAVEGEDSVIVPLRRSSLLAKTLKKCMTKLLIVEQKSTETS